ncbi:hypothetical protein HOD08_03820, partial [bacterium]|nr:hypothetical protein [bacterium]
MNTDKLVIIDGSAMLYRAYYGLRPLTTSKGTPIQAVLGFCKALKKLIREQKPSHMAVAWDMGHSGRSEIHAEYKSTREERPCDLTEQQMNIKKFATAIKLKQLECAGYEADDIIGTVVRNTKSFAKEIIIVTPDKDLRQLVGGNVIVVDPISVKRYDEETCLEKYGFPTSKIRFYHALLGDTSDNIPGVKGIGKKTAQELVTNFENLDDLYANLQKVVKPRTKMLLEEGKEKAYLSYELFGLKEVAVDTDLDSLKFDEDDWKGAYPLFEELEFKSLLPTGILKAKAQKIVDRSWKLSIVKTVDELKNLEGRLANINLYAFDTELDMCSEHHASFAGFSIAFNDSESFFVPVPDSTETVAHGNINLEAAIEFMGRLFSSTEKAVIMHNAKFDMFVLRRLGVEVLSKLEDTLLIAHLLRKDSLSIGLKALSSRVLGEDMHDFEEVIGGYGSFRAVPIEESAAYGAHDALQTFKLFKVLDAELKKIPRLQAVYDDMELPLCKTLLDMEYKGITLDPTKLYAVEKAVDKKREIVRAKLMGAIEEVDPGGSVDLNLNSPRQVEVLLFDVLKLPHVKKSGTGKRSTSHDVLESLCHLHPIPSLMVEHRELAKLKSTYLTPLPEAVNPQTNRIHTNFSQIHVATGRLSSNNPNLQNIPVSGEFGLGVRGAFVAPEGKMFVAADYSQIELRVLAHITKDQSLISAFVNDRDVHIQTAAQIF